MVGLRDLTESRESLVIEPSLCEERVLMRESERLALVTFFRGIQDHGGERFMVLRVGWDPDVLPGPA